MVSIVFKTIGKKFVSTASLTPQDRIDAGPLAFVVTFPQFKEVEYILQFNLNTDPPTNATPQGISISENTVGFTVYVGAGTTVSGEVIASGF